MQKNEETKNVETEMLEEFSQLDKASEVSKDRKSIILEISEDEMKATVNVIAPIDTSEEITREDLISFLKEHNVIFGIEEKALEDIFFFGKYNVDVLVAKGKPPVSGRDSKIEFKFDITGEKKLKIDAKTTEKIDFRRKHTITTCTIGNLLAVKLPPTSGEKGMTVTGKELPAKSGKDIPLPLGENVIASDDRLGIFANTDGQPILKDGKISVSRLHEVKGDVSIKTGNIQFSGSIIVRGNVLDTFSVEATDTIQIYGNVDKAFVTAGGDITVNGGFYGQKEGKIQSKEGSVTIRSIDNGIVEAGKNVIILQHARHSIIIAAEDIILEDTRGAIVGGKSIVGGNVNVANLGTPSFTETIVEIGVNPKIKALQDQINQKVTEYTSQLEKILTNLKVLKELQKQGILTPDKVETMEKLVLLANQLQAIRENEKSKLNVVEQNSKKTPTGKVRISGKAYPGVKIFSSGISLDIKHVINHASFSEQNAQIVMGPY